ncbi:MAG: hypothetical protein HQM10_15260 [Candidatus Riflebacteria bacterium]|nr:hypothetical protein [Candidatus Riflebacteria bacterium]
MDGFTPLGLARRGTRYDDEIDRYRHPASYSSRYPKSHASPSTDLKGVIVTSASGSAGTGSTSSSIPPSEFISGNKDLYMEIEKEFEQKSSGENPYERSEKSLVMGLEMLGAPE